MLNLPTPITIGLCGRAGSGKDTVRSILEMHHDFAGLAFAEPIRAMLRELLTSNGCSDDYITRRELKETAIPGLGISYRQMAQTLGTEWGRQQLGGNFWLNVANTYLADLRTQGYRRFVVSDVRFANEAEWVRQQGGLVWLIDRPGIDDVRPHVSEAMPTSAGFEADRIIHNHSTVHDLQRLVFDALVLAEADLAAQRATAHAEAFTAAVARSHGNTP